MKYTEKTAAAVCNRLLKAARKAPNERLHNAWTDEKGCYCLSDGFRIYRLSSRPDGVRGLSADRPAPAASGNPLDLDKRVFAPLNTGSVAQMPAPDLDAVKAFIAAERQKPSTKWIYDLGAEYPAVNAQYLKDMLQLFPAAKWYVDLDPSIRMVHPVFAVCAEGCAALYPIHVDHKSPKKPESTPAATPATPSAPVYKYCIYSRPSGEKRFLLTDVNRGTVGMNRLYAPRYTDEHLDRIKDQLDECAAQNPGVVFQLRTLNGRQTVYTAVPTYTPESFTAKYAV